MPIVRYADSADPPTSDADWTSVNNQIELLFLAINLPFRVDYAASLVKKGATFYISGTKYLCDADTSITGTASPYVKLLPSGDGSTVSASYVASITGVTWNTTYNGYYDAGTPASQYYFDEHLAIAAGVITTPRLERNTNFFNHNRVRIGRGTVAIGEDAVAIGDGAQATGIKGVSIGDNSTSSGSSSVSIRGFSSGTNSISIKAVAQGEDAIAIGSNTTANGDYAIGIGQNIIADTNLEVGIGNIRYREFASTTTQAQLFAVLYSLLGSNSTARTMSAIGSWGTTAVETISVVNANAMQINSTNIISNSSTTIGAKLKILFITGIHT